MIEESLLKSNFVGRDGFVWWIGQIAPPSVWRNEKSEIDDSSGWAYRCKVRIIGYHTFDGGILPDEDLPWAHVMVDPVDGSGQGGLGKKHNLVGGETAFGFFLDGDDAQQPVVVGLIYRNNNTQSLITPELIAQERSSQFKPFTGHQGNMAIKMTQQRETRQGTQEEITTPESPPAIVGADPPADGPTPVASEIPENDPSADQIFAEDAAMAAALKEALSLKIIRENGCSDNTVGKITQVLQDFIAFTNGLQRYQSSYIDPILNKLVDITSQIKSTASKIAGILKSLINIMRSTIMGLISKIFRELIALILPEPQVPPVGEATKNIQNLIFCLFERLLDELLDFLEDMLLGMVGRAISVPLCAAEEWIAGVLGKLLELLDELLEPIMSGLSWLTGALGQVSSVLSTVSGIANKIISFIGCDQLKCETPSEWSMKFGPTSAEADSWSRVLDNLNVFKSFGSIDNAIPYMSVYGYGGDYFPSCSEEVRQSTPPIGIVAPTCRPPRVEIYGGGGIGASAIPIVSDTGEIISVEIISPGLGFKTIPSIRIIDDSNYGSGATAGAIIENGELSSIYVINSGSGYCQGDYTSFLSTAYYVVVADKYSIVESEIVTFTVLGYQLNTTDSYSLSYRVSGLNVDEIDGASLSGNITLNSSGTFSLQFRPLDDSVNDGFDLMIFDLYDSSSTNVARTFVMVNENTLPVSITNTLLPESPGGTTFPTEGFDGTLGTSTTNINTTNNVNDSYPDGTTNDPQGYLNYYFPNSELGDFVVDRSTNELWYFDGEDWNNTGSQINVDAVGVGSTARLNLRDNTILGQINPGIGTLGGVNNVIFDQNSGPTGLVGVGTITISNDANTIIINGDTVSSLTGRTLDGTFIGGVSIGASIFSGISTFIASSTDIILGEVVQPTTLGQVIGGIILGTTGTPEVFADQVIVISPGVGYTPGDSITIGGISTFSPIVSPRGSIVRITPSSNVTPPTFKTVPNIIINTVKGEGAAVFPVLKLKRNYKTAPAVINRGGILNVVDCV